ncbi:MAG: chain-length determining protein, partial [Gammaproteobacteria bacterium]|nr:chain-length determining protein [Gammaproteobacteria bacterium]
INLIIGYIHGMWHHRWSALAIVWVVALVGWASVYALPNRFSVKAVVYVDTSSELKPLLRGLAVETDTQDELIVMTRMLLSRENLLSVARESDMDLNVDTPEEKDRLVAKLANEIRISGARSGARRAMNNAYEISYENTSANRAYLVVSNLLNTMIEGTLKSTRTDTASAQRFLDKQIAVYEQRLSEADQKLAEFKKRNVGLMPNQQGNYYTRLQNAEDAVEETASALRLAERRYAEITRQLKGESPILGSDIYNSENMRKIKLYQEELDLLLNQYTEQHPDVRALKAIIEELKTESDNTGVSPGYSGDAEASREYNPVYQEFKIEQSKAGVEIELLKAHLNEANATVAKLRESIDVIPEVEAELTKLNRDYDVTRQKYLGLVERRESALLSQSADKSSSNIEFRIIEPPIVPAEPSSPRRLLLLGGVFVMSLGAGLAWSFLRYMLQPTFVDLAQLNSVTGRPVLGSVSLFMSSELKLRRGFQLSAFALATLMFVAIFGAVVLFRDSGTALMTTVLAGQ